MPNEQMPVLRLSTPELYLLEPNLQPVQILCLLVPLRIACAIACPQGLFIGTKSMLQGWIYSVCVDYVPSACTDTMEQGM